MFIIVGLGNPGPKYEGTRHNVGFDFIDTLASANSISMDIHKHSAVCGKGVIKGQKVLLVKPMTFMNLSGDSVSQIVNFYKVDSKDVLICYDDIDLDVGKIRLRKKGSAGGHNGIKSIIARLGTMEFLRIRVGVGAKPVGSDLSDYVLSRFKGEDVDKIDDAIIKATQAVDVMLEHNFDMAMNKYSG